MRPTMLILGALGTGGCSSLLPDHNPFPEQTVISPGVKIGYTFGPRGGLTYGTELTVLWQTGSDLHAVVAAGPALNMTWIRHRSFQLRLGAELVSWFAGIEAGPSLVSDSDGRHFAIGVSPWLSAIFVAPHYTHLYVLDGPDLSEVGTYFKLPLCPGCPSGSFDLDDED